MSNITILTSKGVSVQSGSIFEADENDTLDS